MKPFQRLGRTGICLVLAGCLVGWTFLGSVALGLTKSDKVVKATATASQPDATGKQVVTITLQIDKGWHAYANPVGPKDFPGLPTTVTVDAKSKPQGVSVTYPRGKAEKDERGADYFVYENQAVIKAVVQRAKGDTGPLEVSVRVQACTSKNCLLPATIKLTTK